MLSALAPRDQPSCVQPASDLPSAGSIAVKIRTLDTRRVGISVTLTKVLPMSSETKTCRDSVQYTLQLLDSIADALAQEAQAIRLKQRSEACRVSKGRRLQRSNLVAPESAPSGAAQYEFSFTSDSLGRDSRARSRLRRGQRVRCIPDNSPALRAVITGLDARTITLGLERDLGSTIAGATIEQDAAWIHESHRRRILDLRGALASGAPTRPFDHRRMAGVLTPDAVYRPEQFQSYEFSTSLLSDESTSAPNERQLEAIRHILQHPTTFLLGPPGTGKTYTLSRAIAELLEQAPGEEILVVAPSNAATDVLASQLRHALAGHPLIGRGLIQRVGPNVSRQLSREVRNVVIPAEVLRRLNEEHDLVHEILESALEDALSCASDDQSGADEVATVQQHLADLARERASLPSELARHRRVTVTTVMNVILNPHLWRPFDTVIIDEASLVSGADAIVVGLARSRVVIAGDWQQLGPVTECSTPVVRRALGTDVFRAAGIPQLMAEGGEPPALVMLTEQYRMPREICELISEPWYYGRLITAHRRPPLIELPFGYGPIMLVDTAALEPRTTQGSRANPFHASVIVRLISAARDALRDACCESKRVAVLTLYRAQVDCLRTAQRQVGPTAVSAPQAHQSVVVGSSNEQQVLGRFAADLTATVHAAQGAEAEVVILDLSDCTGAPPTFLKANTLNATGARLLNVGISRTREALIIVANVDYLERTGGSVVRGLLGRLRDMDVIMDARDIDRLMSAASDAAA